MVEKTAKFFKSPNAVKNYYFWFKSFMKIRANKFLYPDFMPEGCT